MKKIILLFMALNLSQLVASEVDLKKSQFKWKGTKVTGEHYGKVALKSASLKMNKDGKIESGNFVIDLNKVTIDDLSGEWADKFVAHIKSSDFFNTEKFPTAELLIIEDTGKEIKAKLTIKEKTNEVSIPYTKSDKTFKGKFTFDRTKFDMTYGSGDFFKNLGDKMIHNDVKLDFQVTLK